MKFLDTNVILRFLTRDDEEKADACLRLFQRVQRGDEELVTCEAVVSEVVYVLSSARAGYGLSHEGYPQPPGADPDAARAQASPEACVPAGARRLRVVALP